MKTEAFKRKGRRRGSLIGHCLWLLVLPALVGWAAPNTAGSASETAWRSEAAKPYYTVTGSTAGGGGCSSSKMLTRPIFEEQAIASATGMPKQGDATAPDPCRPTGSALASGDALVWLVMGIVLAGRGRLSRRGPSAP